MNFLLLCFGRYPDVFKTCPQYSVSVSLGFNRCGVTTLGMHTSLHLIPSLPFLVTRDLVTATAQALLCWPFPDLAPECPLLSIPT